VTPKSALMAALLVFPVLSGCGSSPKSTFYTLSSGTAPAPAPATAPMSVAIGAVTVPDIVNRPQFVVRVAANQVAIDEFARWAAPLKDEIPRVIADNLTQLLNGARVATIRNPAMRKPITQTIGVQRFDSALGDAATVEVLWTVRPPKGSAPRTGRSVVREPAGTAGYEALVAAHSRALARVSADIAGTIRAP
jgi:uncharacterized lipoprotein YmbA